MKNKKLLITSYVLVAVRPNDSPAALIFFDETGKIAITKKTANLRSPFP